MISQNVSFTCWFLLDHTFCLLNITLLQYFLEQDVLEMKPMQLRPYRNLHTELSCVTEHTYRLSFGLEFTRMIYRGHGSPHFIQSRSCRSDAHGSWVVDELALLGTCSHEPLSLWLNAVDRPRTKERKMLSQSAGAVKSLERWEYLEAICCSHLSCGKAGQMNKEVGCGSVSEASHENDRYNG